MVERAALAEQLAVHAVLVRLPHSLRMLHS